MSSGSSLGRIWHAVTALVAGAAVLTELGRIINGNSILIPGGPRASAGTSVIRLLSYFTVESNILVAISAATLALNPRRDGAVWRVVRLSALFGISVTMVTYVSLLAPVHHPTGLAAITNIALHYVAPILAITGWILFGPRPRIDQRTLIWSLAWPAAYIAWTLIHGAASHWYPYPFVDVTQIGYATAIRNGIGMAMLLIGVGSLYMYADSRIVLWGSADRREPLGTRN